MPVKFADLQQAFLFVNFGAGGGENQAFLDRRSGAFHYHSEVLGDEEEDNALPADIDDDAYVEVPGKNDLGLGTELVFDFVGATFSDACDQVRDMFRRRGG